MFNGYSFVDEILRDSLSMCISTFMQCPSDLREYCDFYFHNLTRSSAKIKIPEIEEAVRLAASRGGQSRVVDEPFPIAVADETHTTSGGPGPLRGGPLRVQDRVSICQGTINHISLREKLKFIKVPIVYVYSKKNCLV